MHLDIFLCFKNFSVLEEGELILCTKLAYCWVESCEEYTHSCTQSLNNVKENVFLPIWKNLKSIHVQSMDKLPSRTQAHFCHSGIVIPFKYKVLSLTLLSEPAYTTVQRLVQTNRPSWRTRSQTWKGINSAWVSVGTDISWHGTSASCIFKGRELPLLAVSRTFGPFQNHH